MSSYTTMHDVTILQILQVLILIGTASCIDFQVKLLSLDLELEGDQPGQDMLRLRTRDSNEKVLVPLTSSEVKDLEKNKVRVKEKPIEKRVVRREKKISRLMDRKEKKERKTPLDMNELSYNPIEECFHLYPKRDQYYKMLSSMMNELSEVFIKSNSWLHETVSRQSRRRAVHDVAGVQRALLRRFQLQDQNRKHFFQHVYRNITEEYNSLYDATTQRPARPEDPCANQHQIKKQWEQLLDKSLETLHGALLHSLEEYLKEHRILPGSFLGSRISNYLQDQLKRLRARHLQELCQKFHICYDDETEQVKSKPKSETSNEEDSSGLE